MLKSYVHGLRFHALFLSLMIGLAACTDEQSKSPVSSEVDTGLSNLQQIQARDNDQRPNIIVVFTDDQGYADLGAQGVLDDIITPNIDQLAADGVRMTSGYATAPQCTPSRAGLITGRYQQRFGLDDNRFTPMPLTETTIATRLKDAGYKTGMVGKWHLQIDQNSQNFDTSTLTAEQRIPYLPDQRGFEDVFFGAVKNWRINYDLEGNTVTTKQERLDDYRLDLASDASLVFIDRHKHTPFFLYVAYYAPHVPLEATEKYLSRFPDASSTRRQYGLAMMSAIDDGVGRIREKLMAEQLTDNTLVFFISDNGAPLGIHKLDLPIDDPSGVWDGSLNDPMIGEKGMLSEGGIRVPYIVSWPGTLPTGVVSDTPVTTLDVAATSLAAAGSEVPAELDGNNLLPELSGGPALAERSLFWRFWNQSAVRRGQWKYLQAGESQFLFDLQTTTPETENLIDAFPSIAAELQDELATWASELYRPGIPDTLSETETTWYEHYFPDN